MRLFALFTLFLALSILFSTLGVSAIELNSSNVQNSSLDDIRITVNVSKEKIFPGEDMVISGEVKKEGESVDGSLKVVFDGEYTVPLKYGLFRLEKTLSETTRSGYREVVVKFINPSGEEKIERRGIYVEPLASRLDVYTNGNSFNPGDSLNSSAILRDQNSEGIDSEIVMTLYDSRGATIMQKTSREGNLDYILPRDAIPGEWWVYAFSENVRSRRFFTVNEYPKITTEFRGNEVKIKNMGNVAYTKPLSVTFTKAGFSATESFGLSIGVGEEQVLDIAAPDGEYNIQLNSGDMETFFSGIPLTGAAVGIKSKYTGEQVFIVAAFLLLVLLAGTFFKFRKFFGKIAEKISKLD